MGIGKSRQVCASRARQIYKQVGAGLCKGKSKQVWKTSLATKHNFTRTHLVQAQYTHEPTFIAHSTTAPEAVVYHPAAAAVCNAAPKRSAAPPLPRSGGGPGSSPPELAPGIGARVDSWGCSPLGASNKNRQLAPCLEPKLI